MDDDTKEDERGFDSYLPIWDGRADSLRDFKKTVTWWLHSIDLPKTTGFNLAARFAMRQRGSAKLRALEFDPEDLKYTPAVQVEDPEGGEMVTLSEAVYDAGIQKILAAWDDMVGRSQTDRKGELRERFCVTLKRGHSESIPNFSMRYRTLVSEMKAEGISIDPAEQAWFFKQKLGISELQKQMLETTLGGDTEDYAACERESVRLFKRIHLSGLPGRGPPGPNNYGKRTPSLTASTLSRFRRSLPSSASSTTTSSSWRRGKGGSAGSVHVAEHEDEPEDPDGDGPEVHETQGEDVQEESNLDDYDDLTGLQQALEVMATELDEVAAAGHPEEELGAIEEQIDAAVEALVTLREARSQISALRRDRGFKGSMGKGKGKSPDKGQDKGCFACGSDTHWKGDPECPKTSKSASPPKNVPKFPKPMRSSSSAPSKSSSYRSEAKATE